MYYSGIDFVLILYYIKEKYLHHYDSLLMGIFSCFCREEWTEAIQAVADRLQRQEEERMNCSPTSQIDNIGEEEMDASTTHHKRKVENNILLPSSAQHLYV